MTTGGLLSYHWCRNPGTENPDDPTPDRGGCHDIARSRSPVLPAGPWARARVQRRTGPDRRALRPASTRADAAAFAFNGNASGFPTGAVRLTGGGSYSPGPPQTRCPAKPRPGQRRLRLHASGGPGASGRLSGRRGVRWDTAQLLGSTTFKCTGADAAKVATTDTHTAVLLADFYRAGDGIDESFTAQIIVPDGDLAPDIPGTQTLWVQGVGCGSANPHFNR